MRFYCAYTWFPRTLPEEVWARVIHQHEAGENQPDRIRGWYDLAGGGAGFLIIETDDLRDLTAILRPYYGSHELGHSGGLGERLRDHDPADSRRPRPDARAAIGLGSRAAITPVHADVV